MQTALGWVGVGVGFAGWVATWLMAMRSARAAAPDEGERAERPWSAGLMVVAITLVFWAISMQQSQPFSPGQRLGLGFLIGGLLGGIALLTIIPTTGSARAGRLAAHSMAFCALFGVSLVYLIFRSYPQPSLLGFAIAAAMTGIVAYYYLPISLPSGSHAEIYSILGITLAAAVALAVEHFDSVSLRASWPLPILIATTAIVTSYIGSEVGMLRSLRERRGASYIVSIAISSGLLVALSTIYAWRIAGDWHLLEVIAAGVGGAVVVAWLSASLVNGTSSGKLQASAMLALIIVALAVVAFKLWAGLGIAVGLLAAYSVALPAFADVRLDSDSLSRGMRFALSFGLTIVLYRLFDELYRVDLRTTDLRIHYTFIGALIGAILPFLFVAPLDEIRERASCSGACALAKVAIIGLIAASAPIALLVIWGLKAVLGLVFGVTAAAAFAGLVQLPSTERENVIGAYSPILLIIGAQLMAITFTGPINEIELTRTVRIGVLAAAGLIGIIWLVISAVSARRAQ